MNSELRRNMPLFPIGIVMKLTDLTARQIRYYEQHGLVSPERTEGNQRLFSFNDVERLLEIKSLIEQGRNMADIKQMLQHGRTDDAGKKADGGKQGKTEVSEAKTAASGEHEEEVLDLEEMRRQIRRQLRERRQGPFFTNRGELARFFGDSILKK